MNGKDAAYSALTSLLQPLLQEHGFSKHNKRLQQFIRPVKGGEQRIGLDLHANAGGWSFSLRLHVRLEDVECLRCKHGRPDNTAAANKSSCTVITLMDNLLGPEGRISRMYFNSPGDVPGLLADINDRLAIALPFLERFSNLDRVLESAQSEEGDWPMPSLEHRAETLVIGFSLQEKWAAIKRWVPTLREQIGNARGPEPLDCFDKFLKSLATEYPEVSAK